MASTHCAVLTDIELGSLHIYLPKIYVSCVCGPSSHVMDAETNQRSEKRIFRTIRHGAGPCTRVPLNPGYAQASLDFFEGNFNILSVTQAFNLVFCNFKKFLVIVTELSFLKCFFLNSGLNWMHLQSLASRWRNKTNNSGRRAHHLQRRKTTQTSVLGRLGVWLNFVVSRLPPPPKSFTWVLL